MAFIKINDKLKKRGQQPVRIVPCPEGSPKIKVLVGSCEHCAKLYDNVVEAMNELNIDKSELERIDNIAVIAKMGIITTPAFIVNSKLLSIGRVLPVDDIVNLLKKELNISQDNEVKQ